MTKYVVKHVFDKKNPTLLNFSCTFCKKISKWDFYPPRTLRSGNEVVSKMTRKYQHFNLTNTHLRRP